MAGPRSRGGGRLRLLAGLSAVLGAIALLLSRDARRAASGRGVGPAAEPARAGAGGQGRTPLPDHARGEPPSAAALREGFEPKDANPRAIAIAMSVGVGAIALSIAGLFALLAMFHRGDAARPTLTPQQRAVIAPPGPPLQASPRYDLAAFGARETDRLERYGWLTPERKAARIPIARAMALVTGRPLDPAPGAAAAGGPAP